MAKFDEKVEELIAKHPGLAKDEAIKIVTEKNARKNKKRAEKTERSNAKKIRNEEGRPDNVSS